MRGFSSAGPFGARSGFPQLGHAGAQSLGSALSGYGRSEIAHRRADRAVAGGLLVGGIGLPLGEVRGVVLAFSHRELSGGADR
jgi:hypothetical protein